MNDMKFEVIISNAPYNISPAEVILAIQDVISEKGAMCQVIEK